MHHYHLYKVTPSQNTGASDFSSLNTHIVKFLCIACTLLGRDKNNTQLLQLIHQIWFIRQARYHTENIRMINLLRRN